MATAREELEAQDEFEHVVVNDRLEVAVDQLEGLVRDSLG
jgi:guanylate kinase